MGGATDPREGASSGTVPALASGTRLTRWWKRVRELGRVELPYLAVVLVAIALFGIWWTELTWTRFLAFHLAVYDVGVDYQMIWAAAHGYSINQAGPGATHLILYIFLVPYWLIPSQSGFFFFLISFEAVWVALGALPVYWVAKEQLGSRWVGLCFGLGYLAYPALAGPLWFPVHYETLFPTFFLFGYWLYRRGNLVGAGAFWVVSLLTDAGVTFVIAALGLGIVAEPLFARVGLWERVRGRPRRSPTPVPRRRWIFGLALIAAGATAFLAVAITYGFEQFVFFTARTSFTSGSTIARAIPFNPLSNGTKKLATLFLFFAPLLGLPFWAREERWALVPYLGPALLTMSFSGFLFPFADQYPAFVVPVLFAAAVRGLERPWGRPAPKVALPVRPLRIRLRRPDSRPTSFATTALVVTLALGLVFTPWGPLNRDLANNAYVGAGHYNVPYQVESNASVLADLDRMINMIPPTAWVLVQNNIPQLLNRTNWTVPGFYSVGDPLQYLLTDPYDYNFYSPNNFGSNPASMMSWANYFLDQGWYVVADAYGCLLLSEIGKGPPRFYDPLVLTFTSHDFLGVGPSQPNHQFFDGPLLPVDGAYSTLAPGTYTVTLNLRINHPSPTDQLYFGIGYNYSAEILQNNSISGFPWTGINGTVSVTYSLSVPGYLPGGPAFSLWERKWTGALSLVSIRVAQSGPAA